MKELKFSTSRGKFLLVDDVECIGRKLPYDFLTKIGYIKEITERQAGEIVDDEYVDFIDKYLYRDYLNKEAKESYCDKLTALESLQSLLKSKGIHLFENPNYKQCGTIEWQESEAKTFYNPYLFKL